MSEKNIDWKDQILRCYHCGNTAPHIIVWEGNGPKEKVDIYIFQTYFYLAQCKACNDMALYTDWEASDNVRNLQEAALLYPQQKEISTYVPASIAKNYAEAIKVKKISPTAFAVLIRKCLEYICLDNKATGRSLKDQLEDLAQKGIIPTTLSKMTDILRYLGNVGAHASNLLISDEEADAIDDFFIAVIEYAYIAPKKLATVSEKIKFKIT